jgi:NAD(P)-dependent dehydrogenase (short-subunit alcohol dehydrogenase family)
MAHAVSRRVVVTGVTRGLGRALAEGFAARGHTVAGCGRSSDALDGLRQKLGAQHDFAVVDVASDEAVRAWAYRILDTMRAPDLLVNNAALINPNAPLWQVPAETFDRVIDVNLKGVANVIRHFLPAMIERGSGVVVNLSSGWGRSTAPEVAPYCATKWGVEGLTRALAQELPKGLAAVPLNPGIIDTDMLRSCFGTEAAAYLSPSQWAEAAVPFLLKLGPKDNGKSLTVPGP